MQVEPGMPGQPALYFGMLVRRIVVHDQMQCQGFVSPPVNCLQELEELVVAVPGLALPNHVHAWTSSAANKVVVPWHL